MATPAGDVLQTLNTIPPVRLETTPEFEAAAASSSHNNKGGDVSEGASATGPTFSWASTSSVLDRGREDKEAAELRLEDRMGAAVSKVFNTNHVVVRKIS